MEGAYELHRYFAKALALVEHLYFELLAVFTGHDSVTIFYRNQNGMDAAETFLFDREGKVENNVVGYGLG